MRRRGRKFLSKPRRSRPVVHFGIFRDVIVDRFQRSFSCSRLINLCQPLPQFLVGVERRVVHLQGRKDPLP